VRTLAILPISHGPRAAGNPRTSSWPSSGARNGEADAANTASIRGDEVDVDDHRFASRYEASFQPLQTPN
jgi:hypothetical protein